MSFVVWDKVDTIFDLKTEWGLWIEFVASNKPLLSLQIKSNVFLPCPSVSAWSASVLPSTTSAGRWLPVCSGFSFPGTSPDPAVPGALPGYPLVHHRIDGIRRGVLFHRYKKGEPYRQNDHDQPYNSGKYCLFLAFRAIIFHRLNPFCASCAAADLAHQRPFFFSFVFCSRR